MGSNYSYLKIKVTDYTAGFVFEIDDEYKKIIIAAGHPDKSFNDSRNTNKNEYYNYGDWYYYDGDAEKLDEILTDFDPKKEKIDFLIARLKTECNLEEYQSTWQIIMNWADNVWNFTKNTGPGILIGWFFTGNAIET